MRTKSFFKSMTIAIAAIVSMSMTACGNSDDESSKGGNSSSSELIINDSSYGTLKYAYFTNHDDGTGSFMFTSQDLLDTSISQDSKLSFLAVRIPYTSGAIPTGTFMGNTVDADFTVNMIPSSGTYDMTGWSLGLTITIQKSGNNYTVSVQANNVNILQGDSKSEIQTTGTLKFNYEGSIIFADLS